MTEPRGVAAGPPSRPRVPVDLAYWLSGSGRGGAYAAAAFAVTFLLGLGLQALAIRSLSAAGYATFAVGLSVGNVAAALAQSLQPSVALAHIKHDEESQSRSWLAPATIVCTSVAATVAGWLAAGPWLGVVLGSQVPLHAALAVGLGKIQSEGRPGLLMIGATAYAPGRLVAAISFLALFGASAAALAASLPAGLLLSLAVVLGAGGFVSGSPRGSRRLVVAPGVGTWLALAVLQNADLMIARIVFSGVDAGSYALSFTVGRLPLFAGMLVAMVLLPAVAADAGAWRRTRSLLALFAVLLLPTVAVAALIHPLVEWWSGESVGLPLMVVQAATGLSSALLVLLTTLLYGRGRYLPWGAVLLAGLIPPALVSTEGSPLALAFAPLAAHIVLIGWSTWSARSIGDDRRPLR